MAAPTMMLYGCGACKEKFVTREEMRDHFSTPFHTYNAERKAKGYNPVDFATYKAMEPSEENESDQSPKFYCKICSKYYKSVQTLTAHLKSNQHITNKQRAIEDGASTIHSTASKFLLGSKYVSSKPLPKPGPRPDPDAPPESLKPTPILLLKEIPEALTESAITALFDPFGQVERVLILKKRRQALIQMPSVAAAVNVLSSCPEGVLQFQDTDMPIQYSARDTLGSDCSWCLKPGHTAANCFVRANSCVYCRQEGHKRIDCPQLPCVCCGSAVHTLKGCEHGGHYNGVLREMKQLRQEMEHLVERAQRGDDEAPEALGEDPEGEVEDAERKQRDWLQACACFFCDRIELTPEETMQHMTQRHGFKLPLSNYVEDLYGLLSYLQRKVRAGLCLWCGEKSKVFSSLKALRQHMGHMAHRRLNWTDGQEEYSPFYNAPESTAWLPEADEEGRFELPDGRVITSRAGTVPRDHQPGEYLMAGKDVDVDRRHRLLAYQEQNALVVNPAKRHLTRNQYQKLVRQDIAHNNYLKRMDLKMVISQNGPQFRGFTVRVSRQ